MLFSSNRSSRIGQHQNENVFFLLSLYRDGMLAVNETSFCILKFIQVSVGNFLFINLIVIHRRFFTKIIEIFYHNRFGKFH